MFPSESKGEHLPLESCLANETSILMTQMFLYEKNKKHPHPAWTPHNCPHRLFYVIASEN